MMKFTNEINYNKWEKKNINKWYTNTNRSHKCKGKCNYKNGKDRSTIQTDQTSNISQWCFLVMDYYELNDKLHAKICICQINDICGFMSSLLCVDIILTAVFLIWKSADNIAGVNKSQELWKLIQKYMNVNYMQWKVCVLGGGLLYLKACYSFQRIMKDSFDLYKLFFFFYILTCHAGKAGV